jgi:CheY-like chemotaxis protein
LSGTKLLIFTSAGQRGDGQRCRDFGIEGYLSKPASRTDLLEAVSAVLGRADQGAAQLVTRHAVAEARRALAILLAEDNPVNQEVAATMLRRRGHRVDVVANGREAVDAVARDHYDVVLMDIMMPEMDGYQATAAIRATETGRTLPIVACTAHALSGERERCLAAGMSGYLPKPFKGHDLFAAVEGWSMAPPEPAAAPAATPPTATAIDLDAFRRSMREAGAEDAVEAILATFVNTAPGRLSDLERAIGAADANGIRHAAHAYKSAAATLGAGELARRLGDLEASARQGEVGNAVVAFAEIRIAHQAVLAEIARANGSHA